MREEKTNKYGALSNGTKTEIQTKSEKSENQEFKIFDIYETQDVKVEDPALRAYINLQPRLVLKSRGRKRNRFEKAEMNIIERFANHIAVPGHRGKKHKIMTKQATGKYKKNMKIVLGVLELLGKNNDENPIQILVKAIENAAPRDGITVIEYGGARYPQAADMSPIKRIDLALRYLVHGGYDKAFNKKKNIIQGLAEEIKLASESSNESYAFQKKNESEKQADSAR